MLANLNPEHFQYAVLYFQTDKTRVVDENTGRIWANNCGFYYFETSAQTGDGVNKMFQVAFANVAIKLVHLWGLNVLSVFCVHFVNKALIKIII